jgi:ring-1,2-phenylacetyl-CoA epoxidase subunit PaaE
MTPKFHTLTITDIKKETKDTVSIAFDIPSELKTDYQFQSGQYLTLRAIVDGEDIRRSYSLCSAPFENEWRVAVKAVTEGKFSNFANHELKKGQQLEVMTPTGHFKIDADKSNKKSYVLFASGSGVTPIISIAKTILQEEPDSDVTFFYGNKGVTSIIFREEIEALKNKYMSNLRVVHILSRESLGNTIQKGRIDAIKLEELHKAFLQHTKIDDVFVCGPEEMIHAVKDGFTSHGLSEKQIHFELFTTAGTKNENKVIEPSEASFAANVKVIIDGDTLELAMESEGTTILDAAFNAGGDLPYACKGGVCCTCKAKILEGTAKMDVNYALEPDEIEAGYILTCQAHPTSPTLTVSFDD